MPQLPQTPQLSQMPILVAQRLAALLCLSVYLLLCPAHAQAEELFAPKGVWKAIGFGSGEIEFDLEHGKVRSTEGSQSAEREVRILKQGLDFLKLEIVGSTGWRGHPSICELSRLTDNALHFGSGCIGGIVLIRKGSPFSIAEKTRPTGRWQAKGYDGELLLLLDFDTQTATSREREQLPFVTAPSEMQALPGALHIAIRGERPVEVEQVSDDLLLVYSLDRKIEENTPFSELPPPFALGRIPN